MNDYFDSEALLQAQSALYCRGLALLNGNTLDHGVYHFRKQLKLSYWLIHLVERTHDIQVILGVVVCHCPTHAGMADELRCLAEEVRPTRQLISPETVAVVHREEHGVPLHHAPKVALVEEFTIEICP